MTNSKRIICLVLAAIIMVSTMGLMTALAEDSSSSTTGTTAKTTAANLTGPTVGTTKVKTEPKYIFNFSDKQGNKFISCDAITKLMGREQGKNDSFVEESTISGAKVVYNSDGTIVLSKTKDQYGANLEIPVTDEMRSNYLKCTDNKIIFSYWLEKCLDEKGISQDAQVRVYSKFKTSFTDKTTDGKEYKDCFIKAASFSSSYISKYQQIIDKEFQLYDSEGKALANLDNVESIIVSLYTYSKIQCDLNMSSFAYEGNPTIKEFVGPSANDKNKSTPIVQWSDSYRKKWNNPPSTLKYSQNWSTVSTNFSSTNRGSAYVKQINQVDSKEITAFFRVDPDEYNKGIATANQAGGSKKAQITVYAKKLVDTKNAPIKAEFQLQLFDYNGSVYTPIQKWINQGETKTFTFDLSAYNLNQISYLKFAIMNYWKYCAEDETFYDWDKRVEKDGKIYCNDDKGKKEVDVTKKTLTNKIIGSFETFVSPLSTVSSNGSEVTTTAGGNEKTTTTEGVWPYAGEKFFEFKQESLDETYGENPSFVNFLSDNYYQSYGLNNHTYTPAMGGEKGKKIDTSKDKDYLTAYNEAAKFLSGGYQLQLTSPYPRTQTQHQLHFWASGKLEDESRTKKTGDHDPLKAQNEKYDYSTQMANAVKYANSNPDGNVRGYLAIDVQLLSGIHGYKNTHNATYQEWCKKNGKKCIDEKNTAQISCMIFATKGGEDISVATSEWVNIGQKKTLVLDVSEFEGAKILGIKINAMNYSNLANKEQGGNNEPCGITDVSAKYSAIYVPGSNSGITTTVVKTAKLDLGDAKKIKKLFDALPGLTVDDYETEADYNKLTSFLKAYDNCSDETKKYLAKNYDITNDLYIDLVILEQDVYNKVYFGDGSGDGTYGTGDIAFPIVSVLIASLAVYVVIRTRKNKA